MTFEYGKLEDKEYMSVYEEIANHYGMGVTDETIKQTFDDGTSITYIVFTGGRFTPQHFCRRVGNRIVIAKYSSYLILNADTLEVITYDGKDI